MKLNEIETEKYNYWDLVEHFDVKNAAEKKSDRVLGWINSNDSTNINKMINNKKFRLVSLIQAFMKHIKGETNWGKKITTPEEFKQSLSTPITLWRGGGGEYNPNHNKRDWVSFTGDKNRVATFSKYDGTYASKVFMLPTREKYWVVELTIPLNEILFYIREGGDDEFIISTDIAKTAKLIDVDFDK